MFELKNTQQSMIYLYLKSIVVSGMLYATVAFKYLYGAHIYQSTH